MPAKIHRIKLTEAERLELEAIRDRGTGNALKIKRAVALLLCDEGANGPAWKDDDILPVTGMSRSTLGRLRERCCEAGPRGAPTQAARQARARSEDHR